MDKHKGHKKDMHQAGHGKQDMSHKGKDKQAKTPEKDDSQDMPGADGFRSARADEDTYD